MIHIRHEEHDGVKFSIDYDPERKKFSTLLPGKRKRIEARTEWDVIRDARDDIRKRKAAGERRRKPKPKITFLGSVSQNAKPQVLVYEGVNLVNGDVILKDENGREVGGRHLTLRVFPMTQQGRLAMAHAAYEAARKAFFDLVGEHGKKIPMPSTQNYGDAEDRSFYNGKAQDRLTETLRGAL